MGIDLPPPPLDLDRASTLIALPSALYSWAQSECFARGIDLADLIEVSLDALRNTGDPEPATCNRAHLNLYSTPRLLYISPAGDDTTITDVDAGMHVFTHLDGRARAILRALLRYTLANLDEAELHP